MATEIKKYSFKQGLPQEFEIVDIGRIYKESKDTLTAPHRTGFYHILWFQKGSPVHLVDFNPVKLKPNSILFLNKDVVHCFDKNGGFDGKAILFTDKFFCKTETDSKFLHSNILFYDLFSVCQIEMNKTASLFADLFNLMKTESENEKDFLQADILKNLLHNFLLLSERERRKQNFTEIKKGADLDYIMLFRDLLEINYHKERHVHKYAEKINITEKRLNQASQKILGKSPKQMIDERLMLEAKRLLAHTNESVKEIGFTLGFEEPTNFIKYFRKHSSLTPVEFKEQFGKA